MNRYFKIPLLSTALIATAAITACSSGNDPDASVNPDIIVSTQNPNTGETPSTPQEEKTYIEATATQMQALMKPEDQAEIVQFCQDFAEEFGDFEDGYYMKKGIRSLGESVKSTDAFGITRAMQQLAYAFGDVTGIYEPDFRHGEWVRTGDSSNVEFRFRVKGTDCVLKATGAGGEWSASADGYMEEDTYPYDDVPVTVKVTVPKDLNITLTKGSATLASGSVKTDFNQSGKTAAAIVNSSVANINVAAETNLTNSQCKAHAIITIGGTEIADVNGTLNGHDLCDLVRLNKLLMDEDADYDEDDHDSPYNIHYYFNDGTATANIMKRIFVAGTCDNIAELSSTFSDWDDEDRSDSQKRLDFVNNHIKANFYLGGASEPSGDIIWQLTQEEEGWGNYHYTYWYPEPVMKFNSDGTTYRFSEYFTEGNFSSTVSSVMSLVELYQAFFGF